MKELIKTQLGQLRIIGFLEGVSFILLLGVGMPLKYIYAMPQPNMIIGMGHGILFLLYVYWVFLVRNSHKWSLMKTFWALLASLLPFGTFVADVKLFRNAK